LLFNAACHKYLPSNEINSDFFYLSLSDIYKHCSGINLIVMGKFGFSEILVILVIVLLLFGGKKIPELMKGLGTGIKEFKNAAKDENTPPVSKKEEEDKQ
jgi:sec-independent protein translocase protein TatA